MKNSLLLISIFILGVACYPKEQFLMVPHDQQSFETDTTTFKLRYIQDDQYWKGDGPILFCTGSQGNVWKYYRNSGFMTETVAKNLSALVVFAEHRYFGESHPFEKDIMLDEGYNTYLTVENVLADYVQVVN
tara:strand:+ start:70 stop:465 length:396 start_codon:yes stop_codon:yes gene_type:complete